jgi:hypothetical protein
VSTGFYSPVRDANLEDDEQLEEDIDSWVFGQLCEVASQSAKGDVDHARVEIGANIII